MNLKSIVFSNLVRAPGSTHPSSQVLASNKLSIRLLGQHLVLLSSLESEVCVPMSNVVQYEAFTEDELSPLPELPSMTALEALGATLEAEKKKGGWPKGKPRKPTT